MWSVTYVGVPKKPAWLLAVAVKSMARAPLTQDLDTGQWPLGNQHSLGESVYSETGWGVVAEGCWRLKALTSNWLQRGMQPWKPSLNCTVCQQIAVVTSSLHGRHELFCRQLHTCQAVEKQWQVCHKLETENVHLHSKRWSLTQYKKRM